MKQTLLSVLTLTVVLLSTACSGGSKTSAVKGTASDTLVFRYAENIQVIKHEHFTEVNLRNPWDTLKTLHTYLLVDKNRNEKDTLPTELDKRPRELDKRPATPDNLPQGTVVHVPLENALVYSSVHCSLFNDLQSLPAIAAVCDLAYIRMPEIQEGCTNGTITDCGSSMNPNIERIIERSPDAILLSPFENSGGYGRIEKLGIPLIECADYMETSPLGRAEWMRFFGMLTGKEQVADSLFAEIEKEYVSLKQRTAARTEDATRPTVITEMKMGSAWYVPGGKSTVARLLQDAGARYLFADNASSGSVPLSFETVFDKGQHADFWLIKYNQQTDKKYSEIASDYAPYKHFDAWKDQHIYGCNTSKVSFYEESPFHPERLLKDLIKIFHPELLPDYELVYYSPLK